MEKADTGVTEAKHSGGVTMEKKAGRRYTREVGKEAVRLKRSCA